MDEELGQYKRPTISLLSIITLILGLFLGAVGSAMKFESMYPDVRLPKNLTTCATNLAIIGQAMEHYQRDHSTFPESQYVLIPDYLPELPNCPAAQRMSYRTSFGLELAPSNFKGDNYYLIECCGRNHREARVAPNFPAYDNHLGLKVHTQW